MVPVGIGVVAAQPPSAVADPTHDMASLARVSTRTYIVLAGLTGLLILAAFAVQLVRS